MLEDFINSFKRFRGFRGVVIGYLVIIYYYLYCIVDVYIDVL